MAKTVCVIPVWQSSLKHVMKQLNFELKNLCDRNRDGSFDTQRDRYRILQKIANDLETLGHRKMGIQSLKLKHIDKLVAYWKSQELSIGTIKNRMSALRWWASKIGKLHIIANKNAHYGIDNRTYVTNESKAQTLDKDKLNQIDDAYIKLSLQLQAAFGLRRQESIKFNPAYADQGNHIKLKPSWTKGGKARIIPICNQEQRDILNAVHALVKSGSLIPPEKTYIQQLKHYENTLATVGLHKQHGLRHHYAQQRYKNITGRAAPAEGGLTSKELNPEQKQQDTEVRLLISKELGHERESITAVYLGR